MICLFVDNYQLTKPELAMLYISFLLPLPFRGDCQVHPAARRALPGRVQGFPGGGQSRAGRQDERDLHSHPAGHCICRQSLCDLLAVQEHEHAIKTHIIFVPKKFYFFWKV